MNCSLCFSFIHETEDGDEGLYQTVTSGDKLMPSGFTTWSCENMDAGNIAGKFIAPKYWMFLG